MKTLRNTVLLILFLFLVINTAIAEEAKGTLYFIEGGTGAGYIHLYSGKKLLVINYREYREYGFEHKEGYKYGSIWKVKYHKDGGKNILDSVEFTGKYDDSVKTADELVRKYFLELARGELKKAYAKLSPAWHKDQSFESYISGLKKIKFKDSAESPASFALKIIGHNSEEVLILVNGFWFYENSSQYFRFEVKKINGKWLIDRVTPITQKQWDES